MNQFKDIFVVVYFFFGLLYVRIYKVILLTCYFEHKFLWHLPSGHNNGAPPHYSRLVREYLHASFPNRWLGSLGPVAWPPRSPDLTPLDYYIWGHMKTLVYETKVDSRTELRPRIFAVAEQIRNPRTELL